MPRKSAAALSVVTPTSARRIRPRSGAPDAVQALFRELVSQVPADHFRASDAPLLEQYCQSILAARQAYETLESEGSVVAGASGPKANPWLVVLEKSHRSSVALSARLRLAPQMRTDPKTTGRKRDSSGSPYEFMGER